MFRIDDNYIRGYMRRHMREKKTTNSFIRKNMIIDHWKESDMKMFEQLNPHIKEIDKISAQFMKKMPWTAIFSSREIVRNNKTSFYYAVMDYMRQNCGQNKYIDVCLLYYAAASDACVYSGFLGESTQGRTYDAFVVEAGNVFHQYEKGPPKRKTYK